MKVRLCLLPAVWLVWLSNSNNSGLSAECWHTEGWDILLNRTYTSKSKPMSPTPLEEPGSSRPCSSFWPLAGLLEEGILPVLARILGEGSHAVSNMPAFVLYWCCKKLVMDCSFWQVLISWSCWSINESMLHSLGPIVDLEALRGLKSREKIWQRCPLNFRWLHDKAQLHGRFRHHFLWCKPKFCLHCILVALYPSKQIWSKIFASEFNQVIFWYFQHKHFNDVLQYCF